MASAEIMATLAKLSEVISSVEIITNIPGIVHKRKRVTINGVDGFLVWDYLLYNEISFEDMNGNWYSFYTSFSDKKTKKKWKKLKKEYGIRKEESVC